MVNSELVQQKTICMLADAGYDVVSINTAAILKALSEYEEKYKDMLEYILIQEME